MHYHVYIPHLNISCNFFILIIAKHQPLHRPSIKSPHTIVAIFNYVIKDNNRIDEISYGLFVIKAVGYKSVIFCLPSVSCNNNTIQKHPGCKKGEAKSEAPFNVKKLLDQQATKMTDIRCRPRPGYDNH